MTTNIYLIDFFDLILIISLTTSLIHGPAALISILEVMILSSSK